LPAIEKAFVARPGVLRNASVWYLGQLSTRPLFTKCASGAVLFGIGDLFAQHACNFRRNDKISISETTSRAFKMALWGGLFNSGLGHAWYNIVEKIATLPGPLGTVQRIAYDQSLWSPLTNLGFFTYHALYDGRGFVGVQKEISAKYWPTLKTNWQVWPLVHCVTYTMVPLKLRVLWVGFVGVFWSTFLSYMANDSGH